MNDSLAHIGVKRRSGRYPWNSGQQQGLLGQISRLQDEGLSEKEIAVALDMSTGMLRQQKSIAKLAAEEQDRLAIQRLKDKGMSNVAIAKRVGRSEGSIRIMLKRGESIKLKVIKKISSVLETAINKYGFVDIGEGVERWLGVSRTKLENAVTLLENEGYEVHYLREQQMGTTHKTSYMLIGPKGSTYEQALANRANVAVPAWSSEDRGHTFTERQPIRNIDSSRLKIIYDEDGGSNRDGLIQLRRGVPELSMGNKLYAQVRIGVDNDKYLKGMAVYKDDMPDGVDIIFHTNKSSELGIDDVLKKQNPDVYNPFGATFRQGTYLDNSGKQKLSAINVVNEQGDWMDWDNNLASQFLSKQNFRLASKQLETKYENIKAEYDDIMSVDNPTVKRFLLEQFSESVDGSVVDLKAAAFPGQTTSVLIPDPSMSQKEIYAPNYKDGDVVSLVRYPHGGVFEIPTLTVNNKSRKLKKIIGSTRTDAVGIHPAVAQRLSGADFDGDFVLVIPNKKGFVRTSKPLDGLKDFDPKRAYPEVEGMRLLTKEQKEMKMGDVSNLLTDMTIKGASNAEIARAVRHSMVVIDAENHKLNWQQSYVDNGISALKVKYQGGARKGASTIVSQAGSDVYLPKTKDYFNIDPNTGAKVYIPAKETYKDAKGRVRQRLSKRKKILIEETEKLSSGTAIEKVYVKHADRLKELANQSRLDTLSIKDKPLDRRHAMVYKDQVDSLNKKLDKALRHQPLERKAQLVAGELYRTKKKAAPDLSRADLKKERGRALVTARTRLGIKKPRIDISPKEWEAIQMGALSPTKLRRILRNADLDAVRALATPKTSLGISPAKTLRARSLKDNGYTTAEIALALGLSPSQLNNLDKGGD